MLRRYDPDRHHIRVPVDERSPPPKYRGDPIPRYLVNDWNAHRDPKKKLYVIIGGIETGMFRKW